MENNTNKEKWIDEVMNSTQGMVQAQPRTNLYENVVSGLNKPDTVKVIPLPVKQWAAAAILLIALNVGSVVYFTSQNKTATATTTGNPLASEIQMTPTYNY